MDPTETVDPGSTPPTVATGEDRGMRRWPWGMIAIAIVRVIDAAALLAVALGVRGLPAGDLPLLAANPEVTRVAGFVLGILALVGIGGLLAFQRWGWVLTMVLVGASLAVDLIRVARGDPPYLALLLHMIAAFYLNGRAVRALANVAPDDREGIRDGPPEVTSGPSR